GSRVRLARDRRAHSRGSERARLPRPGRHLPAARRLDRTGEHAGRPHLWPSRPEGSPVTVAIAAPPSTPGFSGMRTAAGLGRSILRTGEGRVGAVILAIAVLTAIFPDLLTGPYQTAALATGGFLEPPSLHHLLGTD